jgi:uncharacterized protein YlaN (UPF0358 family)
MANEMFRKACELSFDDIRSLIYGQLNATLSEREYDDSWITETYDTYFILSFWNESAHKYFKVGYTKTETSVTIDWENRIEVMLYQEWREIPEVQTIQTQLNDANQQVEVLTKQINEVNITVETIKGEKENITAQFNDATEKLTVLNAKVEELQPYKEEIERQKYEKALNEKKSYYEPKFKAVNGLDKFESDEVQNLVKLSLNDNEEGKNAILTLNTMLVDMVQVKTDEKPVIKEVASKKGNLIPTGTSFDERYSE